MGSGEVELGRLLRDTRPRPYLYLMLGAVFLFGGAFVLWLLSVAERDPQTSILSYSIPGLPALGCLYVAWRSIREAVRLLRSRFMLFEGGFELHRAGDADSAPWRDVAGVELRVTHLVGVAVTIRVVAIQLSDGRVVELPRTTPRPEELAREIQKQVDRSRDGCAAHPHGGDQPA